MPKKNPLSTTKTCKQCQGHFDPSELSTNGLCMSCGFGNVLQCCRDLQNKSGKYYELWLSRYNAAMQSKRKGGNNAKTDALVNQTRP